MRNIADVINACSGDALTRYRCSNHPDSAALGICPACGKDLCRDCLLAHDIRGLCRDCRRSITFGLSRLGSILANPLMVLIAVIAILSVAWLAWGGSRIPDVTSPGAGADKQAIAWRGWLFLGKGARLKLCADYLAKKRKDAVAGRVYARARAAFEKVFESTCAEFGVSGPEGTKDESVKERFAGVLVCTASCYRGEKKIAESIAALDTAAKTAPGSEMSALAFYRRGEIYEEDMQDYGNAISMYKAAQTRAPDVADVLDSFVDTLTRPGGERKTLEVLRQLAGRFDPAEAQFRAVTCWRKMRMDARADEELRQLIDEYPFSPWAAEARKAGGIKPELSDETVEERDSYGKKETLTVVPLDE